MAWIELVMTLGGCAQGMVRYMRRGQTREGEKLRNAVAQVNGNQKSITGFIPAGRQSIQVL